MCIQYFCLVPYLHPWFPIYTHLGSNPEVYFLKFPTSPCFFLPIKPLICFIISSGLEVIWVIASMSNLRPFTSIPFPNIFCCGLFPPHTLTNPSEFAVTHLHQEVVYIETMSLPTFQCKIKVETCVPFGHRENLQTTHGQHRGSGLKLAHQLCTVAALITVPICHLIPASFAHFLNVSFNTCEWLCLPYERYSIK